MCYKGKKTPMADAATLAEIAWLCPGTAATDLRCKGAETVCRIPSGDLTLVDEIQHRQAQVAGNAEEELLLAGKVTLPQLPWSSYRRCRQ